MQIVNTFAQSFYVVALLQYLGYKTKVKGSNEQIVYTYLILVIKQGCAEAEEALYKLHLSRGALASNEGNWQSYRAYGKNPLCPGAEVQPVLEA